VKANETATIAANSRVTTKDFFIAGLKNLDEFIQHFAFTSINTFHREYDVFLRLEKKEAIYKNIRSPG
jgi:hypothetical protein